MRLFEQIGLVALGSALGGLSRWGVGLVAARWLGAALPIGTFIINISGSLFLGWFLTVLTTRVSAFENRWLHPDDLRLLVAVGFAGAYTTFSTFEWESYGLLRDGDELAATIYMCGSVVLGLIAVRIGVLLARMPWTL
jgi:CrcB protein